MSSSTDPNGGRRGVSPNGAHRGTANTIPMTAQYMAVPDGGASNLAGGHAAPVHNNADASMSAVLNQFHGLGINPAVGQGMANPYAPSDHSVFYGQGFGGMPHVAYGQPAENSAAFAGSFMPPGYTTYMPYQLIPVPNHRAGMMPERADAGCRDVPALDNRRSSYSTTESTPATPFFGSTGGRSDHGIRVAVQDNSSFTTPSPQQLIGAGGLQNPKPGFVPIPVDRDLEEIIKRDPPIPGAVPAVFTPQESMKTLDQSLVNNIPGNRNVYIRGLHPTTDDALLQKYAERFGQVETSKAIIDQATGACKGFGFAKFCNVRDSEMCIRGFYRLGYEVGFARVKAAIPQCCQKHAYEAQANLWIPQESFNSRLKAEGDDDSTNLYISNLPKDITETELPQIFMPYTILSSKILRDSMGNSRGVGFARFEDREKCDDIIKGWQGLNVGGQTESLPMQIRYADTPAQKELKRVTAERRQFRTNEYNVGAYGTPLVGMNPTIYNQTYRRGSSTFREGGPALGRYVGRPQRSGGSGRAVTPGGVGTDIPASSEDGSGDEGVTIHVESPMVAHGSSRSSPIKKEKD
ncbi:hypothetical protein F4778DRAFT_797630 [Xylariomycetidae sp. FL2044]|nr:hypothetical protein F4778DRAFT_797630 [Xylariomycetidae sp. FL2044]